MRKKAGIIIITIGLIIVMYPILSNIILWKNSSTTIVNYQEDIKNLSEEEKTQKQEEIDKYNKEIKESEKVSITLEENVKNEQEDSSYINLLNIGEVVGYVEVPKVNINLPIYHGVSENVLSYGVGHLENTALPNGETGTHCVLAGHTGLIKGKVFDDIGELVIGDKFYVYTLDKKYVYEVDQIKVVEPDETDYILPEEGKEYVTLLTCVPYGINSHRLLVRGERITEDILEESLMEQNDVKNKFILLDRIDVIFIVIGIILLLILIYKIILSNIKVGKHAEIKKKKKKS